MVKKRSTNLYHCLSTRVDSTLSRFTTAVLRNAMQVLSNSLSIKQTLRYHANFKFVRSGITLQLLAALSLFLTGLKVSRLRKPSFLGSLQKTKRGCGIYTTTASETTCICIYMHCYLATANLYTPPERVNCSAHIQFSSE